MGGEEEIVRIARRLDKMVAKKSADGAMDLLKELKSMPMTLDLLQSTRIGMSVNALRKQSTDEEVISLAKSLIKSWKKLLDASEEKSEEKKKSLSLPTSSSKETGNSRDQRMKIFWPLRSQVMDGMVDTSLTVKLPFLCPWQVPEVLFSPIWQVCCV
ncbi:transcription elongation factor A protein 2 isoform X1 [Athene cunicularia]|uniref:transcription elongation factor A protein 2 isoform X1 n=1 Tax=Athene cunicularia TaxID=194338 RepID=UPI000EF678C9|nr:transcription elongation factor A protein 2 isoform X1 [Athene cunicularia]